MEKIRNVSRKDWQRFFPKETFLVYPTLTNFTQRKRKTYDANDLLGHSLASIIEIYENAAYTTGFLTLRKALLILYLFIYKCNASVSSNR